VPNHQSYNHHQTNRQNDQTSTIGVFNLLLNIQVSATSGCQIYELAGTHNSWRRGGSALLGFELISKLFLATTNSTEDIKASNLNMLAYRPFLWNHTYKIGKHLICQ
jgi:hypothetical protein